MGRKPKANKVSNQVKDSPMSIASSSNRNIGNLITTQQQTLASQASVYTQRTNRSRTTSLPDEEDFF